MYRKIFVTGATGFVGKNLISHLKKVLNKTEIFIGESSSCDLRDLPSVKKQFNFIRPDCIIHLAAVCGGIGANKNAPGKFMRDNLTMGLNVINTALELNCVKKFIMTGTICAYPKYAKIPFDEREIWDGYPEETNAPYGIAKKTLMELLLAYNKQYGFNSINLLPTNMYGPYDHFNLTSSHVIPAIILKIYHAITKGENKIEVWGTGKVSREFLYVDDFCRSVTMALEKQPGPEPINIGTGHEITIKDLIKKIAKKMGYDGKIEFDSSKPDGQPRRCVNIRRAGRLLNYIPKTSLDTGLDKTIEWFLQNVNSNNIQ